MATPTQPVRKPGSSATWDSPAEQGGPPISFHAYGWNKVRRGLNLVFWGNLAMLVLVVAATATGVALVAEPITETAGNVAAVVMSLLLLAAFVAVVLGQVMALSVPEPGRLKTTITGAVVCLLAALFFGLLASLLVSPTMAGVSQLFVIANVVFLLMFLATLGRYWNRRAVARNGNGLLIALGVLLVGSIVASLVFADRVAIEGIGTQGLAIAPAGIATDVGLVGGILAVLWLAFHIWFVVTVHLARRAVDVSRLSFAGPQPTDPGTIGTPPRRGTPGSR